MEEISRSGEGSSGGSIISATSLSKESEHSSIVREDFAPRRIEAGETEVLFQRHGKYDRELTLEDGTENPVAGRLGPESSFLEEQEAEDFLRQQIEMVTAEERGSFAFMFVASDTTFGQGQRSMETADIALKVARKLIKEYGLAESQILNNSGRIDGGDGPRAFPLIREPRMFDDSPQFVDYLKKTFDPDGEGLGQKFWIAFEEDLARDVREEMGAEGPDGLADRLKRALAVFERFASRYHMNNPDKRLIIWAASHYDIISAFTKREIYMSDKNQYVGVDYGSGLAIKVDREGKADTLINGKKYRVH